MNTLKSLAFIAVICATILGLTWIGKDYDPPLSAADKQVRDAYPQLLGTCEALESLELDGRDEWNPEAIYQIWRFAVKATATARGVDPRETRAHFEQ